MGCHCVRWYACELVDGITGADRTIPRGFAWPVPDKPIAFVCVGRERHCEQRTNSGSLCNSHEAAAVCEIVQGLLSTQDVNAGADHHCHTVPLQCCRVTSLTYLRFVGFQER